jgi:6-phosphogluconolactonase (cycloisomerase 2 family)
MQVSRRQLLKSSAVLAVMGLGARAAFGAAGGKVFAYVGTYSSPIDGGAGNGKGIYLFEMELASGELTPVKLVAEARNASWLAVDPKGRYLYSVNEIADFGGASGSTSGSTSGSACGSVSAYRIDRSNGDLTLLNVVSSEGAGPAHLSVDATGKYVFVANYAGGSIAVLPIHGDGSLGRASFVHRDTGSVGRTTPTNASPGSFAFSGHDKPHAHMIQAAPGNRFVVQTDLGQDRIYVHRFDAEAGKLAESEFPYVTLPDGDGPRHFAFHGNGRWMYSLQEEASNVVFFLFDAESGKLSAQQTISILPPGFKGSSFASEILVSADGRFVYAVNRLHNSVAVLAIGFDGRLAYLGEASTLGDYPRHIGIDPKGDFLYACNQRNDSIASFRIDRKTGLLSATGAYTAVGSPAFLLFLG